jgi:hypothetical protein
MNSSCRPATLPPRDSLIYLLDSHAAMQPLASEVVCADPLPRAWIGVYPPCVETDCECRASGTCKHPFVGSNRGACFGAAETRLIHFSAAAAHRATPAQRKRF